MTYATMYRAAVDMSLSENPLGASPKVAEALCLAAQQSHLYPQNDEVLIALIAEHHHVPKDCILLGAGANELLEDCLKILAIKKNIVVPTATFPESVACMKIFQGTVTRVNLQDNLSLDLEGLLRACKEDTSCIHLCNPNNPTGIWTEKEDLIELASASLVPILVSEAGADFINPQLCTHPNIITIRSFSKAYGLAGLRIGYAIATEEIVREMKRSLRSYRMSSLAIAAAIAAIQDQEHLQKSIAYILEEKTWLVREMRALNFKVIPSQGQTFIAQVPDGTADEFCMTAKSHDIAVVNCSLYPGLENYIRISPQKREINKKFISILKKIKGEK